MSRLPVILLLLAAPGGAGRLHPQTPDSTRTFSSTHTDSTRIYFTQVVYQPPRVDTLWCSTTGCSPTRPAPDPPLGVPFGPSGLWKDGQAAPTQVAFTASQNYTSPDNVIRLIASARAAKQKLILSMTGGAPKQYSTNGAFDLRKWEARIDQYNTPAIRDAIAAGVADGTVLGNSLMDEPEHKNWGGAMSKPLLDTMAGYAKQYFPTLPMGPSHGPNGYYQWRPAERYRVVDYVLNQYNYWVTDGDVAAWREKVLAQAKLDGVGVGFSMNILDGGEPAPRNGAWNCPTGTSAGHGTHEPACRMTATQIRDWGKALGPSGCVMMMWRYDSTAMTRPDNVQAMRDVAAALATARGRTCTRGGDKPTLSRASY
ncbi:MAG TPA: hypothetical protein VFN40_12670 [Gemmatimonadales bacterium]|nr:hypothetical protein [Gemmatimonadales bacterium]